MQNKVFCLLGPTASGKTALACELIKRFPFEIISVDSAMIYRDMDIGTAKPSQAELAIAPHHLLDIIDPPQSFSVAEFCSQALPLCQQIIANNKIPLLAGGTMMYFHALQHGLSLLPEADDELRGRLLAEAEQTGWESLHNQLKQIDPIAANKIHAHDTQRIQRALEVFYLTGQSITALTAKKNTYLPYQVINLVLLPSERAWLHQRIAQRFDDMLDQGFLKEVGDLLDKWQLPLTCPAMRTVGYRQAGEYIAGKLDYAMFREQGIAATRQLAKRQITWLRKWQDAVFFVADKPEMPNDIVALVSKILDNH